MGDYIYEHMIQTQSHNQDEEDYSEFHPIYNNSDKYLKVLAEAPSAYLIKNMLPISNRTLNLCYTI